VDLLTAFGALAVASMLVFYALEDRSARFILAFAGACLASSAYGFLQGAWPFGVVELIWSGVALRRWRQRSHDASPSQGRMPGTPPGAVHKGEGAG
jgi:hypothetical protein